ncbi:Serine-type endopeptidase [Mycena sanguinolenta]|uniref:Serine-type endopeptidase n=1 Tax=Mycena sanguinolenta TaxID=230812 RepID=A0A8H6XD30_9AGAR|nr:Serine-type endopeptidase [Mycena sanguinolenta]
MPSTCFPLVFVLTLAVTVSTVPLSSSSSSIPSQAPLLDHHIYGSINDSYIVVLKPEISPAVMQNHFNLLVAAHERQPLIGSDFAITHVYDHINGYAGRFSEDSVEQLRAMPEVDFIERDQGLARISHRPKLTLGTFSRYEHDPTGGNGVDVYVIDTGINTRHSEFEGRAEWGLTALNNEVDEDTNGHGTHCAGIIASRTYGVAKAARVIAVKVLGSDGKGSTSSVIAGVLYAVTSAVNKAHRGDASYKGSVINMSLGGGRSRALDRTVNGAVDAGLHVAVAAGNDKRNACDVSPARAEKVITVGASTIRDERAYFSNYGECVDVFAPGMKIRSTFIGSNHATSIKSGTSMASPHTAGMLAYLVSLDTAFVPDAFEAGTAKSPFFACLSKCSLYALARGILRGWFANSLTVPDYLSTYLPTTDEMSVVPSITPAQTKRLLLQLATPNVLTNVGKRSPNLLIFNNYTESLEH